MKVRKNYFFLIVFGGHDSCGFALFNFESEAFGLLSADEGRVFSRQEISGIPRGVGEKSSLGESKSVDL